MACYFFAIFTLGTLPVVTSIYDTSNYIILTDLNRGNFTFWEENCRGLGFEWATAILDTREEFLVLEYAIAPSDISDIYWIGGSSNRGDTDHASTHIQWQQYKPHYGAKFQVYTWLGAPPERVFSTSIYPSSLYSSHPTVQTEHVVCEKNIKRSQTSQTFLFKGAETAISSGIRFASNESFYWKYVGSPRSDFTYWSSKCTEFGDGWAPAVLDSDEELDFILQVNNLPKYYIGGSTNVGTGRNIQFSDYISTGSGNNNVLITGRSKVKSDDQTGTLGILCEKKRKNMEVGFGLTLSSTTFEYRKMINDNESPKTYEQWMHECSSIGYGWGTAVVNSQEEFNFIKEAQKFFINSHPYFLGGSIDLELLTTSDEYADYIANNSGIGV